MNIGERIKERRNEIGLSVEDVAKKLNKNRATIYRYESNEIENLPISILEPLSKILQTTPSYLMGWEDDELPTSQNMKNIMNRIQARRLELKLSYQDLAAKTNMSKSTLQRYETGSIKNMPVDKLGIIANALEVSPIWLLGLYEEEHPFEKNNSSYSEEEKNHIEDLRKLNDMGKKKVITYTKDLIEMPKYQKQIWEEEGKEHLMPIASHSKKGDFTEEQYKHDDDIMTNDDLWK